MGAGTGVHAIDELLREGWKMTQRAQQQTITRQPHGQPRKRDLIFHSIKIARLVSAILKDRRVSIVRKGAYLGVVGLLLGALIFPELFADLVTLITPLLPLEVLEIPADATIDWVAFVVATFSLLKLFPKEIVGEHYDRLFRR
jgi:hypothetical protein